MINQITRLLNQSNSCLRLVTFSVPKKMTFLQKSVERPNNFQHIETNKLCSTRYVRRAEILKSYSAILRLSTRRLFSQVNLGGVKKMN